MTKYTRLTKEQFEELHEEFIHFLATQTITSKEWNQLKKDQPDVAEQELDVFSDLIWEGVLNKTKYLENISKYHLNLFQTGKETMNLIVIKILDPSVDVTNESGMNWLQENVLTDMVEIFTANKDYSEERNLDKFNLIKQGAIITNGELYRSFSKLIG
jgi:hypothetical protein